ncbi:ABC transporter ATP-binding protein [Streptomyces sp. NPDC060194]|uniref:ABC transporter ATP-binding protein n=1 Tax=Streptomyces sp. NPDC060194 TaxID=3347069 RepID=UPI00364BD0B4
MVAPPEPDVLRARALHVSYAGSPALTGVSLDLRPGEILAVAGPRGAGKTTLLRCLSGQLAPDEGEVFFEDLPLHPLPAADRERLRHDRFGWIDPRPRLVDELTAWENAALPLLLGGAPRKAAKTAALAWLERLDIADCAKRRPAELLQAERQRVTVARALSTAPAVLFADEPTASLHRADRDLVLRTLTTAARSHGIAVVLATHDGEAVAGADRTITLLDGRRTDAHREDGPRATRSAEDSRAAGAADDTDTEGQDACSLSV